MLNMSSTTRTIYPYILLRIPRLKKLILIMKTTRKPSNFRQTLPNILITNKVLILNFKDIIITN